MILNEDIRAREVRLIGVDGQQVGVVSKNEALRKAADADLDLVLLSPNAKPPVARIMDYGKFRFEQQKKAKENRKNQKVMACRNPPNSLRKTRNKLSQGKCAARDLNALKMRPHSVRKMRGFFCRRKNNFFLRGVF